MPEPQVLKSWVHSVDVFRSGAVVTRAADLEGKSWPDEIALDGLPLSLEDDSVRIRVVSESQGISSDAKLPRPSDVRVSLVVPEIGATMEPPNEKELRDAADEVARLETEVNRIHSEIARLDSIQIALPEPFENRPPKPTPAAAWMGVIEWTQKSKAERVTERVKLEDELMRAREKWARLQRRDQEARAKKDGREDAVRKRVIVRLREGGAFVPSTLRVEYRVPGARWVPTYVFRMARDGKTASLGVRALVVQQTGEAWERVKLSLSTADLLRDAELPELMSLRIGRKQPAVPKRAWREAPTGMELLFEGLDRALATMRPPPPTAPPADLAPMPPPPPPPAEPAPYDGVDQDEGEMAPEKSRRRADEPAKPMPKGARGMAKEAELKNKKTADKAVLSRSSISTPAASAPMPRRAPMAPPPAQRAPAPGALGGFGAASGASMSMDDAKIAADMGDMEEQYESEPEEDSLGVTPQQALLQYGNLMMASWQDAYPRGRLRPMVLGDRLVGIAPAAAPAVARKIAEASNAARQVDYYTFPPDTTDPSVSSGAYDHRYQAEGIVDVPSDGKVHNVPLFARGAPVGTTLVVVPRESEQAVRIAAMKNPLDAPLLAGPAEIYLEDEFLVTSPIRTVPAGADLKIGLGIEPALKVARNVHFDEEAHGVFGGGASLKHDVEIEIASRLAAPVRVEVRERVPVKDDALDKEIEINLPEATPPWEEWDQADVAPIKGGRRWRFELKSGEAKKLKFSYLVKIDSKNEIVGGNRRE